MAECDKDFTYELEETLIGNEEINAIFQGTEVVFGSVQFMRDQLGLTPSCFKEKGVSCETCTLGTETVFKQSKAKERLIELLAPRSI